MRHLYGWDVLPLFIYYLGARKYPLSWFSDPPSDSSEPALAADLTADPTDPATFGLFRKDLFRKCDNR